MSTNSTIDWDAHGHCIICHENLVIDQYIDGGLQKRLSPKYDTTTYLLSDGSNMRVVTCKKCKPNVGSVLTDDIMNMVIKGWEKEVDLLVKDESKPEWTDEKKVKHMAEYSKKKIVMISDGKGKDHEKKALKKFKETKVKEKNGSNRKTKNI